MSIVDWVKRLMARKPPQIFEGRLSRAATVGQYFTAELLEPAGLTQIDVDWPDDVDLQFEQNKETKAWMISGIVQGAKMYEFILRGTINAQDVTVNLRLPASPDPWTIWKDLPVDWATLPYPKDDTDSARIKGDLTMIAASRRGRSHAHKALPRDDDMRIYHDATTGWHIATVADGAGSAAFSRFGSQTAVETVITELPLLLAQHFTEDDIETALLNTLGATAELAATAVEDLASASGVPEQAFSTTLLIGIARQTKDEWFFASISIGDGMIGLIADDEHPLMMSPDGGAYAGQTRFLRKDAVANKTTLNARIHHRTVPSFTAFMLMTDGVSDPMFASDIATQDGKNWITLLDQITSANATPAIPTAHDALCEWLNFKVKGEHDDRTIAIMFPNEVSQ
jgi:serine/threonine protein phosphatase PrpC